MSHCCYSTISPCQSRSPPGLHLGQPPLHFLVWNSSGISSLWVGRMDTHHAASHPILHRPGCWQTQCQDCAVPTWSWVGWEGGYGSVCTQCNPLDCSRAEWSGVQPSLVRFLVTAKGLDSINSPPLLPKSPTAHQKSLSGLPEQIIAYPPLPYREGEWRIRTDNKFGTDSDTEYWQKMCQPLQDSLWNGLQVRFHRICLRTEKYCHWSWSQLLLWGKWLNNNAGFVVGWLFFSERQKAHLSNVSFPFPFHT